MAVPLRPLFSLPDDLDVEDVEPALGLVMDLAPLNRGVLLLVGETTSGRVCWVERAGMALDVRTRD